MCNNPTPELNMDSLGKIIDDFIEKSHFQLLLDCPEGTNDINIEGGINPVLNFFFILNGMIAAMKDLKEAFAPIGGLDWPNTLDALLEEVKKELLKDD